MSRIVDSVVTLSGLIVLSSNGPMADFNFVSKFTAVLQQN
jgi:hypothetical protein